MNTTEKINVLAIPGSLRAGSLNRAALRAAAEIAPENLAITIAGLDGIPLYNSDDEAAHGYPEKVAELRDALAAADALLIATPEYNYSITGVLKNALDWLSRGGADSPLRAKPTAILGAGGRFGTMRSQQHLREILLHSEAPLVATPQVTIDRASTKFSGGVLTDERHRDQIARLLAALADLTARYRT